MANLIQLTEHGQGEVWINTDQIVAMVPLKEGTEIIFAVSLPDIFPGERTIEVKESPQEVAAKTLEARSNKIP